MKPILLASRASNNKILRDSNISFPYTSLNVDFVLIDNVLINVYVN